MSTPFEDKPEVARPKRGMFATFRSSFLTGLVVVAPIALTLWLIWTVAGWVDGWVLPFVPLWLRPDQYLCHWPDPKRDRRCAARRRWNTSKAPRERAILKARLDLPTSPGLAGRPRQNTRNSRCQRLQSVPVRARGFPLKRDWMRPSSRFREPAQLHQAFANTLSSLHHIQGPTQAK